MPVLPKEFLQAIASSPGYREASFVEAHQQEIPVSIRRNPFKPAQVTQAVKGPVSWCEDGSYLQQRPNFTYDPLFQAGCYYVQEAGSMFLDHVLRSQADLEEPLTVLDLCAAPGGKSTLAVSALNAQSLLVSNEVIKARAEILSQNLSKWGTCNTIVSNADPRDFSEMYDAFDIIIADAPCSGSGLFRKQEDAIQEWSPDLVNLCSQRQKRILADVLPALKPGGLLVYSTCSYSMEENEEVCDWLMEQGSLESTQVPLQAEWGIVESISEKHSAYGYRFYPDRTVSEGFFCTIFRKAAIEGKKQTSRPKKANISIATKKEETVLSAYINTVETPVYMKFKDDFLLMNEAALLFMNAWPQLYIKKAGTRLGSILRDELIPHHDLALSIHASEQVPQFEADEETWLRYMKKEIFTTDSPKGWNLVSYKGYGLGWIKNLGNRVNNYLPNEYKILH